MREDEFSPEQRLDAPSALPGNLSNLAKVEPVVARDGPVGAMWAPNLTGGAPTPGPGTWSTGLTATQQEPPEQQTR